MVTDTDLTYFSEMARELLSSLGYSIVKEMHRVEEGTNLIPICAGFDSKNFLMPPYSPNSPKDLCFVSFKTGPIRNNSIIKRLQGDIEVANGNEGYQQRVGGRIVGGLVLCDQPGRGISNKALGLAGVPVLVWDLHRIFFYAMKVFSHSMLENWVSESKLGFVLKEEYIGKPIEDTENYKTSCIAAIRYSDIAGKLEFYFSYYADCLKDPNEAVKGINALHSEHVKKILDDAYERLEIISKNFRLDPGREKKLTIEIHSLSGFTQNAEYKAKLYAPHHKVWEAQNVTELKINEHTLFKYSIIPWEAVMDYAFTKQTHRHTILPSDIKGKLEKVEKDFVKEFVDGVTNSDIQEPWHKTDFTIKENKSFAGYKSLFMAHVTRIPIKQRMIIFSRTSFDEAKEKVEEIERIVDDIRKDPSYNYNWIGIMSGSGFSSEEQNIARTFKRQGMGLGLIDAVTRKLVVNTREMEGNKLKEMLLSECIT